MKTKTKREQQQKREQGGGRQRREQGARASSPLSSPPFSFSSPSGPPILPAALAAYIDSRAPSEKRGDEKSEDDVAAEAEVEPAGSLRGVCRGGERGGGCC